MFDFEGRFAVRSNIVAAGQYVATNALGARVVVNRFEKTVYELEIEERSPFFDEHDNSIFINLKVPMAVREAISAKVYLRLALVCTITKLEVRHEDLIVKATIESPEEVHWHERILPVKIDRIIVFDSRTGRICATVGEQG